MSVNWNYYLPSEVVIHNKPDDCWVSCLGKVFNVTPLIKENKGKDCIKPLLAFAGKDVNHWFDQLTGDIQYYVHPISGVYMPFCPHGNIPDVIPGVPTTTKKPKKIPWWENECYQVGLLTKNVRPLRIINMLISKEATINVCEEDTFSKIAERYSQFNKASKIYSWRHFDKPIDMDKTLDENGIFDEREKMGKLGIAPNSYIPSVLLYFTDDFEHVDNLELEFDCSGEEDSDGSGTNLSISSTSENQFVDSSFK